MSSFTVHTLDDPGAPESLMATVARLPMPLLLDSSDSNLSVAAADTQSSQQFSIYSAEPVAWLLREAGNSTCSHGDLSDDEGDIFRIIKELSNKYIAKPEINGTTLGRIPFAGGVAGYLGYPVLSDRDRFHFDELFIGVYLWALILDHQNGSARLVFQPNCPPEQQRHILKLFQERSGTEPDTEPGPESDKAAEPSTQLQALWTREQYQQGFDRVKDYIEAGDCYQVNLTQAFAANWSGDAWSAYKQLRKANPGPFSSFINWGSGALLSLSPERFIQVQGERIVTQPIKGTRPRHADSTRDQALAEELQASEKDRAENLMIVDLLRNDLGRVCRAGSITVEQLFELKSFASVHHLVSTIRGSLAAGMDAVDALAACFPGGSITGAPKLRAMEIIQEVETCRRQLYCGSVFYLGADGNLDSNITIRSLLWNQGRLRCWAGGGIVADSECDQEYNECFDKIDRIIKSLN